MWHLSRLEIPDWFDQKLLEFAKAENQNSELSKDKWLERYVHDGPHKYFFSEFSIILYEWLAQFTYRRQISKEEIKHPRPMS